MAQVNIILVENNSPSPRPWRRLAAGRSKLLLMKSKSEKRKRKFLFKPLLHFTAIASAESMFEDKLLSLNSIVQATSTIDYEWIRTKVQCRNYWLCNWDEWPKLCFKCGKDARGLFFPPHVNQAARGEIVIEYRHSLCPASVTSSPPKGFGPASGQKSSWGTHTHTHTHTQIDKLVKRAKVTHAHGPFLLRWRVI